MSPVNLGDQHPQGPSLIDPGTAGVPISLDFQGTMAKFEKDYLKRALEKNGGRINRTARQIGMNKTTLLRRIRVHQILAGNELLDQQST
jgi:transcriptional regulator of acetoin/glycerol metabolism